MIAKVGGKPRGDGGVVIVTGIPGAGKSAVARELARQAPMGAHLDIDVVYEFVVGGIVFRSDSPAEDWWQLELARRHVAMLATSFVEHGVIPFVDDVIAGRAVLDLYRSLLPPPVRLVVLAPSMEVVLDRDARRDKHVAARWSYLAEPMALELREVGLWIDTSDLDLEATVAAVKAGWEEMVVPD